MADLNDGWSEIAEAMLRSHVEVESTLLSLLVHRFHDEPCSAKPHGLWTSTADEVTALVLEGVEWWQDWPEKGPGYARRAVGEIAVGYGDLGIHEKAVRSYIVGPVGEMMYAIGAALRGDLDGEVEPTPRKGRLTLRQEASRLLTMTTRSYPTRGPSAQRRLAQRVLGILHDATVASPGPINPFMTPREIVDACSSFRPAIGAVKRACEMLHEAHLVHHTRFTTGGSGWSLIGTKRDIARCGRAVISDWTVGDPPEERRAFGWLVTYPNAQKAP